MCTGRCDCKLLEQTAFRRILANHCARYPQFEVQDVYKLIHQGVMASEHAIADPEQARAWLEREAGGLGSGLPDPVIDPISQDGRIARVHLRPYLAAGGDLEALLEAFICTANEQRGTKTELKRRWSLAEQMAEAGELELGAAAFRKFFSEMEQNGFPAVHHSEAYTRAYKPAYRVVVHEFLGQAGFAG